MLFTAIRTSRPLKLAALFAFAATTPLQGLPRENPDTSELRTLATEYAGHGPLMPTDRFERFNALMKKLGGFPEGAGARASGAFCAHGSAGAAGGPATTTGGISACPALRRRIAKGDLSHLLVINHWI